MPAITVQTYITPFPEGASKSLQNVVVTWPPGPRDVVNLLWRLRRATTKEIGLFEIQADLFI